MSEGKAQREAPMLGEEELPEVEAAPLPSDAQLSKVRTLALQQLELEGRIAKGTALLKQLAAAHKQLSEQDLPLAMKELGMTGFDLVGGVRVEVGGFTAASIPKDKVEAAHAIVEKLGEGSIIKHAITIMFARDEDAWAKKFLRDMARRKKPLNHSRKDWIEPQTLMKFVRDKMTELRKAGRDPFLTLPKETFGIYEGQKTTIVLHEKPK